MACGWVYPALKWSLVNGCVVVVFAVPRAVVVTTDCVAGADLLVVTWDSGGRRQVGSAADGSAGSTEDERRGQASRGTRCACPARSLRNNLAHRKSQSCYRAFAFWVCSRVLTTDPEHVTPFLWHRLTSRRSSGQDSSSSSSNCTVPPTMTTVMSARTS